MAAPTPELEEIPRPNDYRIVEFSTAVASRGFHVYKAVEWNDIQLGDHVMIQRETSVDSPKIDRFSCAVRRLKTRGLVAPTLVTVGHVPLEISKLCHFFLIHGGEISGVVEDIVPRRSPIPSGGLEIKLKATFKAVAPLADKMKVLLRAAYDYEFQDQGRRDNERDDPDGDNENDCNLLED